MSETPRTDEETWETIAGAFKCTGANGDLEGEGEYVKTGFARQLERELHTAQAAAAEMREALEHVVQVCEEGRPDSAARRPAWMVSALSSTAGAGWLSPQEADSRARRIAEGESV